MLSSLPVGTELYIEKDAMVVMRLTGITHVGGGRFTVGERKNIHLNHLWNHYMKEGKYYRFVADVSPLFSIFVANGFWKGCSLEHLKNIDCLSLPIIEAEPGKAMPHFVSSCRVPDWLPLYAKVEGADLRTNLRLDTKGDDYLIYRCYRTHRYSRNIRTWMSSYGHHDAPIETALKTLFLAEGKYKHRSLNWCLTNLSDDEILALNT